MEIVIRAGGAGTRLWPLSRRALPKQFRAIFGSKSMIASTLARLLPIAGRPEQLWVSVNAGLLTCAKQELPELADDHFIIEPVTRNTGPAVCLEVCFLEKRLSADTIIASLPSDDYISDQEAFRELLAASEQFISEHPDYIVAPAVKPDYPETGYSYLEAGERLDKGGNEAMFAVERLAEKPSAELCEELIESGRYYWHTGMYVWRLGRIIELFERYQPKMIKTCREFIASAEKGEKSTEGYAALEKLSIESAVIDHVDSLAMSVSNRLGWSDVGKWPAVKRLGLNDKEGNAAVGKALFHSSSDNFVHSTKSGKLIVLNGVRGLAVIDTDDVLLISALNDTEEIKEIIAALEKNDKDYL